MTKPGHRWERSEVRRKRDCVYSATCRSES
jgi:hypothetical protein